MLRTITVSHAAWFIICNHIKQDYGIATALISYRMLQEVGCIARNYNGYESNKYVSNVRLDFYDGQMKTMFLLKYSDFLHLTDC